MGLLPSGPATETGSEGSTGHGLPSQASSQFQADPMVGESRVNRAWSNLAYRLDLTGEAEIGPDDRTKAALATG